jgi:RHS repeat-associated protein
MFTGEQTDDELGFVYLRARYYDPVLGRFLSSDDYPWFITHPETINRYVYVAQNPVNQVDPSGNIICTWKRGDGNVCDVIKHLDPKAQPPVLMEGIPYLLKDPVDYAYGVWQGIRTGEAFTFEEDVAVLESLWNLGVTAWETWQIIFEAIRDYYTQGISGISLVPQAYAAEDEWNNYDGLNEPSVAQPSGPPSSTK